VIRCDRFTFVHFPKAAGTWVREGLGRTLPEEWRVEIVTDRHVPAREVWTSDGPPMLGIVRDPWSWYASWYSFWVNVHKIAKAKNITPIADPPPEQTLEWLDAAGYDFARAVRLAETLAFVHLSYRYWYDRIFCDEAGNLMVRLVDYADIRAGLLRALQELGVGWSASMLESLKNPPRNVTSRPPTAEMFVGQGLIDLVRHKNRALIEKHGLRFPYSSAER